MIKKKFIIRSNTNIEKQIKIKELNADVAPSSSSSSRMRLVKTILTNMDSQMSGRQDAGILLAGHPGVGKTTFIYSFAKLLGLSIVSLEIPHITEEHIVTIPFIKVNPINKKVVKYDITGEIEGDLNSKFSIELAESNLLARLKKEKKISDADYLKRIYDPESVNERRMYEALGGTRTKIPARIQRIREQYSVILFLDEFFRKTSTSIRNMLRGLLNKDLGLNRLPPNVYPIFASNIDDEGVDDYPSNYQFNVQEVKAPEIDEWLIYVDNKAKVKNIPIKKEVLEKIGATLKSYKDNVLSIHDDESDVMLSPRRWENLLLLIDACLPLKGDTVKEARALLTNIKANFSNYQTNKTSELAKPLLTAVTELIQEFNGIKVPPNVFIPPHMWVETLKTQIQAKIKLGDERKYVPVISGPPGVGKTSKIEQLAIDELCLCPVRIDCSTLSYEDVMGTPLSEKSEDGSRSGSGSVDSITFSDSKLFMYIHERAKERMKELLEIYSKNGRTPKFENGYKYLIFFDELNRTNVKTFNGLRKLILEKKFDNGKGLPEKSVVVAAINPEDAGGGVTELTRHMSDVLDIIPASPSWTSLLDHIELLRRKEDFNKFELKYPQLFDSCLTILKDFADTHKDPEAQLYGYEPHFKLILGADLKEENPYISPREYTQMFIESMTAVDQEIDDVLVENNISLSDIAESEELKSELRQMCQERVYDVYAGVLSSIFLKNRMNNPEFLQGLKVWMENNTDPLAGMFEIVRTKPSIKSLLINAVRSKKSLLDNAESANLFRNVIGDISEQEFMAEVLDFCRVIMYRDGSTLTKLLAKTYPNYYVDDELNIKATGKKLSVFAFVLHELVLCTQKFASNEFYTVLARIKNKIVYELVMNKADNSEKDIMKVDDFFTEELGTVVPEIFNKLHGAE